MISPGGKGWIDKFFSEIEEREIQLKFECPKDVDPDKLLHMELGLSGVIFGFPSHYLFFKDVNDSKWTNEEKLKFLLFESLLLVYLKVHPEQFNVEEFKKALLGFYQNLNQSRITKLFASIMREKDDEKLEKALEKRVDIRLNLENKFWINYLCNSLVFLDVLLFDEYLRTGKDVLTNNYEALAENVLKVIILAAHSDGEIDEREEMLFDVFLASAHFDDKKRKKLEKGFKKGLKYSDLDLKFSKNKLYNRYVLDVASLTIFSDNEALENEIIFLHELCNYLEIDSDDLHESINMIETFVFENNDKIAFLQNTSSVDKLYSNLTKRWIKIIGRNKDKLANELKESKDLVALISKSRKEELTPEEKERVKVQFKDLAKSMPALAIFMLPGGAILLPIILKIIPDLIPSSFKENDVTQKKEI